MKKDHQLKYIVLSDLHLGENDSLFTSEGKGPSKLLAFFSDCLADTLQHFNNDGALPIMVFNGDILGLAFSTYQESLSAFEHFSSAMTVQNKICEQVIYIPGNHDHQIWQQAMEDDYRRQLDERKRPAPIPELKTGTSPLQENGIESAFLKAFMPKGGGAAPAIKIIYPNLVIPPPSDNDPYIFFHHGHFAETTYHFVSKAMQALYPTLRAPENIYDLERQNGSWINFAFSQLGRSGEAGQHFEELMSTLSSEAKLSKNKDALSENVATSLDFPFLPFHWMEKFLTKRLLTNIANKVRSERYQEGTKCSNDTLNNLIEYFQKFGKEALIECGWKDEPIHFVWSHTHKPFEKIMKSTIFGQIKVTNTGGWVLPSKARTEHGASIIFINQSNEVQSLRIFMDREGDKSIFKVKTPEGEKLTSFGQQIHRNIYNQDDQLKPCWAKLRRALEAEIETRRKKSI